MDKLGLVKRITFPVEHILRLLHPQKKRVRSDACGGGTCCRAYFEAALPAEKAGSQ